MNVTQQLYQLQEVDLELEANEQALSQITSQMGGSQAITGVQTKLVSARQHFEELQRQQHTTEWEIKDLTVKITAAEEKLYSGRITNPKELANIQHEVEGLKAQRNQLEDKVLEIMEQVEEAETSIATASGELSKLETEWQNQQQRLSRDLEQVKATLSELKHKRQLLSAKIDLQMVELYHQVRKHKGEAVAKVKQGICAGCRISLSSAQFQQVRGGNLVQCSNCGRILYLA